MFGNPTAGHQVLRALDLPVLFVIFNNAMSEEVERAALSVFPDGAPTASRWRIAAPPRLVAMARLVFAGLFDRHPQLDIITHHLGGMIPFFDKRIETGLAVLGSRTREEDCSGVLAAPKRAHIDYFKMFHADTALFGASHELSCGLDFFGPEKVVFATDAPFGPVAATRDAVASLDIDVASGARIFCGNAERLLRRKLS